jgi:hypothetical protein
MPQAKKTPWVVLVMGKMTGMVMANAKAGPLTNPAESMLVATPAFSRGTKRLTSLGRLG